MKKKFDKDFWLWFGGAALVLILIISFLAIPYTKNYSESPKSTETTKSTDKSESTNSESTKSESPKTETTEPENKPEATKTPEPEPTSTPESTPAPAQTYTTPSTTPTCYHEEGGRCWDDLEDEAYSAGQYDRQFGYYGATLEYADNCDALCREIIEDAYDEGWYDF